MGIKKKKITQSYSKRFPHFNETKVIPYNDEIPVGFYLSFTFIKDEKTQKS